MLKTGHDGDPVEQVSTLIDQLLAEQRQLTAVAKFSRAHDRHHGPLLESHYRDLIPLTAPRPGEQFAFEVNLDQCSGCKGCVTACHSLNGLDDDEAWREVGFLVGEAIVPLAQVQRTPKIDAGKPAGRLPYVPSPGNKVIPLQQTVTTACHHCAEPGCMLGCPVLAYDKDPITGIVRHLDDQCIGCSYCILKCPYDVPKYSAKRGIVRKCDMCHGRLAEGEAPACVQACPNEAIRITLVNTAELAVESRKAAAEESGPNRWLADAPDPAITLPTTRYLSSKSESANCTLHAADHSERKPQHAHWPLVLMLVLTQAGIGGFFAVAALSVTGATMTTTPWLAAVAFALLSGGLLASVFHLGQPTKAWRVWLGWRTSWLSREAIALNAFAGAATGGLALLWVGQAIQFASRFERVPPLAVEWLRKAGEIPALLWCGPVVGLGLAALYAQTMVYADTHRKFWRISSTGPRFLGSALVLGTALAFAFAPSPVLAVALILISLPKLASDLAILKHADSDSDRWTQLRHTAALQLGPLRPALVLRLLAGLVGGVFLPFAFAQKAAPPGVAAVALGLCLLGEMSERYLFFTSVAPDKMPGMP